ncbi:uncharacterized protein LODBEIA_P37680 [Lodderomyces beijingensis]|uniref:Rrp15p-domain-containing protein n=1 Tax=Lodderomyces beijingensis TaxID=1775926 RepID=A0ABP0ZNR9_9ASCO
MSTDGSKKGSIRMPKSTLKNQNSVKVTEQKPNSSKKAAVSTRETELESQDSNLDEESELDENDEVNVVDVSSDDDDEEEEEEEEDDDDDDEEVDDDLPEEDEDSFPLKKKQKKNKDNGSESFATAFNSIINSKLKAYDRKDPILVRNKATLKKLESDKLENKARKSILAERKQFQDKHRVKNLLPAATDDGGSQVRAFLEKEKQMKKTAQRGVVRLFNAVLSTQLKTNQEVGKEKVGQQRKEELMTDVSKEKFLDLIAAAGED